VTWSGLSQFLKKSGFLSMIIDNILNMPLCSEGIMKRVFFHSCRKWSTVAVLLCTFFYCGYLCLSGTALADVLTVTTAGAGSGSVNSTPSGIACTSGSSSGCSAAFANLSGITLTATPDWKSLGGVFSGGCSGTGSCSFNINGDTGVTASFDANLQAAVIAVHPVNLAEFSTLAEAYSNTPNDGTFAAHIYTFYEDLVLNRAVSVTFYGGMGGMYLLNYGNTTLQGSLEVQQGSIVVDSLIIQ
jgi:hypothetical protein